MKALRTLILGSAAGLVPLGSAQAADLPVKAKAVEYVRVCSLYGAGFFYIPGTDTCIKFSGYFRADVTFNGGGHGQPAWNGDLGQQNRYRDNFIDRSRMVLTIDTRTATEYGVVRTFGAAKFQFTTLGGSTLNPDLGQCDIARRRYAAARHRRAAAMSPSNISSSSSRASPSASRRPPMQTPGRACPATSRHSARRPEHRYRRQQHPVHGEFGNGVSAHHRP